MEKENGQDYIINHMLVNGNKVNQMDLEFKFGQIKINIKDNF